MSLYMKMAVLHIKRQHTFFICFFILFLIFLSSFGRCLYSSSELELLLLLLLLLLRCPCLCFLCFPILYKYVRQTDKDLKNIAYYLLCSQKYAAFNFNQVLTAITPQNREIVISPLEIQFKGKYYCVLILSNHKSVTTVLHN